MALFDAFQYTEARERMLRMGQPQEEGASEFLRALAYLNDQLGDRPEAKSTAARALAAAGYDIAFIDCPPPLGDTRVVSLSGPGRPHRHWVVEQCVPGSLIP